MNISRSRLVLVLAAALATAAGGAFAETPARAAAPSSAQSSFPFDLKLGRELSLFAAGGAFYGSSYYFQSIKASPNPAQIDPNSIPFFDRLYTTQHSSFLGYVADGLVGATGLLPFAALPGLSFTQIIDAGVMYAETIGTAYGLSSAMKSIFFRYRPYAYSAPASAFSDPDIASSFPSNHSTLTFASATFAGYLYDQTHPNSPYRWLVWAAGLGLATTTASIRIASGDHFLSDVVAGAALGAACGFVVPWLHRVAENTAIQGPKNTKLNIEPLLPGGFAVKLSFQP